MIDSLINYFEQNLDDIAYLIKISSLLIIGKLFCLILQKQYFFYEYIFQTKSQLALTCFIFDKILKMPVASYEKPSSQSEIINYILIDCNIVSEAIKSIFYLSIYPIEFIIYISLLFQLFGLSFLLGIIPFLLSSIVNYRIFCDFPQLQNKYLTKKDKRMKITSEVLEKIKLLKMYSWEKAFECKVRFNN